MGSLGLQLEVSDGVGGMLHQNVTRLTDSVTASAARQQLTEIPAFSTPVRCSNDKKPRIQAYKVTVALQRAMGAYSAITKVL